MFWWMIVGLLVLEIILLALLLVPLPLILTRTVVDLLDKVQKPMWVVLVIMCWVLFGKMNVVNYGLFVLSLTHPWEIRFNHGNEETSG